MNDITSVFVVVSDAVRNHWIHKGLHEAKIIRIYNGIHPPKKIYDQTNSRINGEYRLIMLGGLSISKGQDQAIRMMTQIKKDGRFAGIKVSLDIIGNGSRKFELSLRNLIKEYGLEDNVHLLGYRKDAQSSLHNYDIGLMLSKCEGFGRVTVEYMMAGLPVLASDRGANPELIRDGISGYLYSYGNFKDMTDKLLMIMNNSWDRDMICQYAIENYSDIVNIKNILNLYQKVYRT